MGRAAPCSDAPILTGFRKKGKTMGRERQAVIVSAVRTPIGSLNGSLSTISATELGAAAIRAALQAIHLPAESVDEVMMGCVLSAGLGQAPARQAALRAGLPYSVGATTINKVCGSGLKALIMATQMIRLAEGTTVVAGGMENMSLAPYILPRGLNGRSIGHIECRDSLVQDGLWDVYNNCYMGTAAELCVSKFGIPRAEVDDVALESYQRAKGAIAEGRFAAELIPIEVPHPKGRSTVITEDEEPNRVDLGKLRQLKPVFTPDGVVTAGNSTSCNDGAAALVVMAQEESERRGIKPLATIVGSAASAVAPEWFSLAPVDAIQSVLKVTGLSLSDIDLFEINEPFSAVLIAVIRQLGLDRTRINVNGGAVALGHPIGASGARIVTTLVHSLESVGARRGLATICIGGGEALAIVIERGRQS